MNDYMTEMREREKQRIKEIEGYRNVPGFSSVHVVPTGVGNIVNYLRRQNLEETVMMKFHKSGEDGNLREEGPGSPTIKRVLDLIVETYNELDVRSFVGVANSTMDTYPGMYFRLIFGPKSDSSNHIGSNDLCKGIGATKAYEIFCDDGEFGSPKYGISTKQKVEYAGR